MHALEDVVAGLGAPCEVSAEQPTGLPDQASALPLAGRSYRHARWLPGAELWEVKAQLLRNFLQRRPDPDQVQRSRHLLPPQHCLQGCCAAEAWLEDKQECGWLHDVLVLDEAAVCMSSCTVEAPHAGRMA